ncbi:MAG: ferritin-like domain-containing protein, partial [Bacteroidales bacterium]
MTKKSNDKEIAKTTPKTNHRTKSIELLNRSVADELLAVHQYMYFHFHCDDMNYDLLSSLFKRTAIQEMMHVETLADRILFLKGEVEMKPAGAVAKIHDVSKMLEKAMEMENGSVMDYNQWANECGVNADAVTKKLFEDLVMQEETHLNQFENEAENLQNYGDKYLVLQSMERSKAVANT